MSIYNARPRETDPSRNGPKTAIAHLHRMAAAVGPDFEGSCSRSCGERALPTSLIAGAAFGSSAPRNTTRRPSWIWSIVCGGQSRPMWQKTAATCRWLEAFVLLRAKRQLISNRSSCAEYTKWRMDGGCEAQLKTAKRIDVEKRKIRDRTDAARPNYAQAAVAFAQAERILLAPAQSALPNETPRTRPVPLLELKRRKYLRELWRGAPTRARDGP